MPTKRKGSDVWYTDFYSNGKRVRVSTKTNIKREAIVIEKRIQEEHHKTEVLGQHTWLEAKLRYIKHLPQDRASLADDFGRFDYLDKFLDGLYVHQITGDHIAQIKEAKLRETSRITGKPISNATVNRLLVLLSGVLRYVKDLEWIDKVPPIKFLDEPPARERVLTNEESVKLITHASPHLKPVITFALQTGMRKANILNLKWSQVNFEDRTIKIAADEFKNRSHHEQPLSEDTLKLLEDLLVTSESEYVFTYRGKPMKDVKKGFHAARERAGIDHCRFHDLRRTCATRLRSAGVSLENIQAIIGWKDFKTALGYARKDPKVLQAELAKVQPQSQMQSQLSTTV